MKPFPSLAALLFLPLALNAQQADTAIAESDTITYEEIRLSAATVSYHKYREHLSYPPYGADKVNALIRKQVIADRYDNLVLKTESYNALSLREKFTYNMLHAEEYSQNCEAMPMVDSEQVKIFSFLPDAFNEFAWSDRQLRFFKDNKDSVLSLMKECMVKNKRVGINFKQAILEMNAVELIPELVSIYQISRKDNDLLTLLMLLMKENKYQPFISSASFIKLYGPEANYQGFLKSSRANGDLIIKRATEFYNANKN